MGKNDTDGAEDGAEHETVKIPAEHFDCIKWICDGATTMAEVAQHLRSAADQFDQLARQDAVLMGAVDSGVVRYVIPGHDVDVAADEDGEPIFDDDMMCPSCYKTQRCL